MKEIATDIAKLSPSGSVAGLNFFGVPLPEVVIVLTIVYTLFMIVDKVVDFYYKWKARKHEQGK